MPTWAWDETLFAGAARYDTQGRAAYPPELAENLATALRLDGTGRLLDIGCGPGSIALMLAPYYGDVIGVDADAEMVAEATRLAAEQGVRNATWRRLRGEELPGERNTVMTNSAGRKVNASMSLTLDGRYSGPGGAGDLGAIVPYMTTDVA